MGFIVITAILVTITSQLSALEDQSCNNLVPGLDRINHGVDITKLDLFHDYTISIEDGFVNRLFTYQCTQGTTWTSPYDNKTYQVPDQIDSVVALSTGMVISDALLIKESHYMKKMMSAEAGVDAKFKMGMFSGSLTYKTTEETIVNKTEYVATNKAFDSVYQVTYAPAQFLNQSLSKYAQQIIDQLPPQFDAESASLYMEFFSSYGTHYFERSNFGGTLSIWFELDVELDTIMTDKEISAQVEASFLGILKAHGAYNGSVDTIDERFTEHSRHKERYYGGEANLFSDEGFKEWWPTVPSNPWVYSGQLRSIMDIFPDSHPKKKPLIEAYQVYLSKAYLGELDQKIKGFMVKPGFYGQQFLIDLDNNITNSMSQPIVNESLPEEYKQQFDSYIHTPDWFLGLELCMQFNGYNPQCFIIGVEPPLSQTLDRCPCPQSGYISCASGKIYFNTQDPKIIELLDKYKASFQLITRGYDAGGHWWHQVYQAKFVLDNSPGAVTPGWLRNAQICSQYDDRYQTIDGGDDYKPEVHCVSPNTLTPESLLMHKTDDCCEREYHITYYMIPYETI